MATRATYGLLFLLTFGFASVAWASEGDSTKTHKWYVPYRIPFQFAGNIGLASTGAGYAFNEGRYEVDFLYGYVPASVAAIRIHTIAVRNTFPLALIPFREHQNLVPYAGVGLTLEVGGNSFFSMPDNFPDGYYDVPKNLHVIGYGGIRLQHHFSNDNRWLRGIEYYAESGTIDVYLWYKAISNTVRFSQVFSVALGVNLLLNR